MRSGSDDRAVIADLNFEERFLAFPLIPCYSMLLAAFYLVIMHTAIVVTQITKLVVTKQRVNVIIFDATNGSRNSFIKSFELSSRKLSLQQSGTQTRRAFWHPHNPSSASPSSSLIRETPH